MMKKFWRDPTYRKRGNLFPLLFILCLCTCISYGQSYRWITPYPTGLDLVSILDVEGRVCVVSMTGEAFVSDEEGSDFRSIGSFEWDDSDYRKAFYDGERLFSFATRTSSSADRAGLRKLSQKSSQYESIVVEMLDMDGTKVNFTTDLYPPDRPFRFDFSGGRYFAKTEVNGKRYYSEDGRIWELLQCGLEEVMHIAFIDGRWIAYGSSGKMAYSTNLSDWVEGSYQLKGIETVLDKEILSEPESFSFVASDVSDSRMAMLLYFNDLEDPELIFLSNDGINFNLLPRDLSDVPRLLRLGNSIHLLNDQVFIVGRDLVLSTEYSTEMQVPQVRHFEVGTPSVEDPFGYGGRQKLYYNDAIVIGEDLWIVGAWGEIWRTNVIDDKVHRHGGYYGDHLKTMLSFKGEHYIFGTDQSEWYSETRIWRSEDGNVWSRAGPAFRGRFNDAVALDDKIIAVGLDLNNGRALTVTKTVNGKFEPFENRRYQELEAIAYNGDIVCAVGWQGTVLISRNSGASWFEIYIPELSNRLRDVVVSPYGGFVIAGNGVVVHLDENMKPTVVMDDPVQKASWYHVTYGNGVFLASSSRSEHTMISRDGINWTPGEPVSEGVVDQIFYKGRTLFLVHGPNPTVKSTYRGESPLVIFTTDEVMIPNGIHGDGENLFVFGQNGSLMSIFPDTRSYLFHLSVPVRPGYSISPWLGGYWDSNYPWIYSEELGWLYHFAADQNWIFHPKIGYVFVVADCYPWVYGADSKSWINILSDEDS